MTGNRLTFDEDSLAVSFARIERVRNEEARRQQRLRITLNYNRRQQQQQEGSISELRYVGKGSDDMDIPHIVEDGKMASYNAEQWLARSKEVQVPKSVFNDMIMNYLIIHGYQSTAQKFSQEADMNPNVDLRSLGERRHIVRLIHDGDIKGAVEKINEVNPELLDRKPDLHFALLRLQLIELIKRGYEDGDIQPALDFASSHLAQRAAGPNNPQFLADLEKAMALICFPPDALVPSLKELTDIRLRRTIAEQVNTELMESQELSVERKIENLTQLWAWGESNLETHVNFPKLKKKDLL